MVKIEDCDGDGAADPPQPNPAPAPAAVKAEEAIDDGQPGSSSSYLRSHFIGMGFSPILVDKMLQKHGDHDSNTILESLLSHHNSGSESSSSLGSLFDSDNEENSSKQDIKPEPDSFSERRSYLLRTMNFSQTEVDLAFNQLGEDALLDQLVDFIVTAQGGVLPGDMENGHATNEVKAESLFGVMDKTLHLLQMGFTEEEVSLAIDSFGQEAAVQELADSIFARRIASTIEQKQVKIESEFLGEQGEQETEYSTYHQRLNYYDDDDDNKRVKKAKHIFRDDRGASSSHAVNQPTPWLSGGVGSAGDGYLKEEDYEMTLGPRANVSGELAKPPFFLYGNVVNITKDAWSEISGFLSGVRPEFINSQLFSALMRREGYLHNLPTERRHVVVPKSPMTIEDAVPSTRHYWPTWDTRKHIGSVTSEVAGIEQLCEMLGKTIKDSRGLLSEEKRAQILHQCKMANLIWIGQDRLGPLQPNQMERILGYPSNHTNLFGLNPPDRIAAMKYAFQTDTIAYLLSVLKDIYPDGLRVLSIYSGVGGAEIALHRLGIPLKCVVSVEESDVNRKILKRWWAKTEQSGVLRQLNGIWKLKTDALEDLFKEFGGFDLVVGGNYSSYRGGTTVNATMGMDSSKYFEYVRVLQRVRSMQHFYK
ncbi:probable inactive DNA (cytosine-5)-methyltransferase DRM3 [Aegilops tauschii subsp. strangulata]|uniref:SAM-dependent MTase DRM-type domain-containing protein n=3 Tax=Triticinae TaxID=1648030 RepID=A0A453JQ28_AEGTS|nr:probable inactive DNA (cytosine-5)-methyltransferase DRM3 [Aegilops tauschii subsp. strangulata]XP_044395174.1 probable inactive DNA (cytosine-5)-methyltransferase DRM3 [Triticum aestivum]